MALDGMAPEQALAFSAQVDGLRWVKVGLELFVQAGPEVVAQLREQGLRVFLDLKFHDIPATMAGACRRAAALGAELITVHACAGSEALQVAQAAAVRGAYWFRPDCKRFRSRVVVGRQATQKVDHSFN